MDSVNKTCDMECRENGEDFGVIFGSVSFNLKTSSCCQLRASLEHRMALLCDDILVCNHDLYSHLASHFQIRRIFITKVSLDNPNHLDYRG